MMTVSNQVPIRWAFNIRQWMPTQDEWQRASQCIQKEELEKILKFVYRRDAKASMELFFRKFYRSTFRLINMKYKETELIFEDELVGQMKQKFKKQKLMLDAQKEADLIDEEIKSLKKVGQLLMRKAATETLGVSYNKVQFSRTEYGKPYICNAGDNLGKLKYSFNISHHGDFCVIAAQNGHNVGADVMKVEYRGNKPLSEYFELMKKQFSNSEWEFMTLPGLEKQQLEKFFRLWCLKESYVKAKGTGISCALRNISFLCPTACLVENNIVTDSQVFVNGCLYSNWRFEESMLDKNHCVAVSVEQDDVEQGKCVEIPKFTVLTFEDVMRNSIPFENYDGNHWLSFTSKEETL